VGISLVEGCLRPLEQLPNKGVGADEVCDGNGCRSPRSSTLVFDGYFWDSPGLTA
jgi:hypothetical protein